MAVGAYHVNGKLVATRAFSVPRRASELKYWYVAARKAMPQLPEWNAILLAGFQSDIDVESIILDWKGPEGLGHRLIVARKRQLL